MSGSLSFSRGWSWNLSLNLSLRRKRGIVSRSIVILSGRKGLTGQRSRGIAINPTIEACQTRSIHRRLPTIQKIHHFLVIWRIFQSWYPYRTASRGSSYHPISFYAHTHEGPRLPFEDLLLVGSFSAILVELPCELLDYVLEFLGRNWVMMGRIGRSSACD